MAKYRITSINRTLGDNKYESIKFFGGVSPNGTTWRESLSVLIIFMKNNPQHTFYVESGGSISEAYIVPASSNSREHIRTFTNGIDDNKLFLLGECE